MGNDDLMCADALAIAADLIDRHENLGIIVRGYAWFKRNSRPDRPQVRTSAGRSLLRWRQAIASASDARGHFRLHRSQIPRMLSRLRSLTEVCITRCTLPPMSLFPDPPFSRRLCCYCT
jgi:hypothetical protein